jgi:hypothetical protein
MSDTSALFGRKVRISNGPIQWVLPGTVQGRRAGVDQLSLFFFD